MSSGGRHGGLHRGFLAFLGVLVAGALAAPATAAPPTPPLPACADTITADHLSVGQSAVGYTVSEGTTVQSFDVKILGVLHNAVAPGRDLVIVDASGPVIDQGGGIWAGMSGSPVYTLGGRLIGSVSYGFSATSTIGGVTPADPDMLRVLDEGKLATAVSSTRTGRVELSHRIRSRIARREGLKASSVAHDLTELRVPVSVSGLAATRRAMLRRGARRHHLPFLVPAVAGASAAVDAPFATATPGDSFAAVISYGDVSFAGIGTTTYVCDGEALAFGHPFFFTGSALFGASAATAFGVVNDPEFGPYKLADVTDPLGVVDRDRLGGIRAQLGHPIPTVPVVQDTTASDGRSRIGGETDVVQGTKAGFEGSLPFLTWLHSISNIDSVFDQVSGGSSRVSFTIRGIRKHSRRGWRFSRSNDWISKRDISYRSTLELLGVVAALDEQNLAPIKFTGIHIKVGVEQAIRTLKIKRVLWSAGGGRYRAAHHLRVNPGQRLAARIRLRPSGGGSPRTVLMKFKVPHRGDIALVSIGGGSSAALDPFCVIEHACGGGRARSFKALLAELRSQPHNNDLVGELDAGRHHSERIVHHQRRVVEGRAHLLLVIGGAHHHHHHRHLPPNVVALPAR